MMRRRLAALPVIVCALLFSPVSASSGQNATVIKVVKDSKDATKIVRETPLKANTPADTVTGEQTSISIGCSADVNCKELRVWIDLGPDVKRDTLPGKNKTATSAQYDIPNQNIPEVTTKRSDFLLKAALTSAATDTGITLLKLTRPAQSPNRNESSGVSKIGPLLSRDCSKTWPGDPLAQNPVQNGVGKMYVSPSGAVLARPPERFKEGDALLVYILADPALASVLSAVRTSTMLVPGQLSIAGEDVQIPTSALQRLQAKEPPPPCIFIPSYVFGFAGGKGTVQIQAQLADGSSAKTGSFEFGVVPTYDGAFSLGAIRTELGNPTFGLAWNGKDSIIVEKTGAKPRVLYSLFYTPFLHGRRELAIDKLQLNPTVGLVLNDIGKNAILGATLDWNGSIYFTGGLHAGLVNELAPNAKANLDSAFVGPSSSIPTRTRWKAGWFWGASIDLRAAAGLLKAVSGATTSTSGG